MFSLAAITDALSNEPYGQQLHFFHSIGSTNTEAMRLASTGAPEGTLVIADEQTAGRGRAGRRWVTPQGSGLAASIVLRPELPSSQIGHLALLGGIATAQAIESLCQLRPQLKWPNDVLINNKKVAGILGESSQGTSGTDWVVLGIGINVTAGPPQETEIHQPATYLEEHIEHALDRVMLLLELVRAIGQHCPYLGKEALVTEWERRMVWRGKRVTVVSPDGNYLEGMALGLAPDGELRLQPDHGNMLRIIAGEVSLYGT